MKRIATITTATLIAALLSTGAASATDWRHTKTPKSDWRHSKTIAHTRNLALVKAKADAHKKFVWGH